MTDSSSPDSSPASRNTFAHHLGMKGFLLMEGLLKLVGMKTLYRLGRAAGAVAWHLLPQRRNIVERNLRIVLNPALRGKELQKLSRENFKRTIANFLCSAKTATLTDEQLKHCVTVGGHEQFAAPVLEGRGQVCAIAHSGNWEKYIPLMSSMLPFSSTTAGVSADSANSSWRNSLMVFDRCFPSKLSYTPFSSRVKYMAGIA